MQTVYGLVHGRPTPMPKQDTGGCVLALKTLAPIHAILATLGTDGDVIPYIALGARLRQRGHRLTLVAGEPYREAAAEHDLEFAPLLSADQTRQMFDHPEFWNPLKGPHVAARYGARLIGQQYELLSRLAGDGTSVLVSSPAILAARLVHEKLERPLVTLILQPWMIPSFSAPPVMPVRGLSLPAHAPRAIGKLYYRMLDFAGELLMGRELNGLRRREHLPPVRRVFQWWLSPQLALGLFADWYGPPQSDWPPQIRLTGFPMSDGRASSSLSAEVVDFCQSGPPPIVITFGTGMIHGADLYRRAIEACEQIKARAIVLTRHPRQLPRLPSNVKHFVFAPFQRLFPLCAAVIHHGGIGTVAKAFAAGVPQLVLPIAYDQLDNAIRVKRLGAGEFIRPGKQSSEAIADALCRLMSSDTKSRCGDIASRFRDVDALAAAAQSIEQLAAGTIASSAVSTSA